MPKSGRRADMQEQTGSMRLEPRVGVGTEVVMAGRAKELRLPSS